MWIERLTTSRTTHALELAARFAEERHKVLTENVANIDTPDYHTRRLDVGAFQTALKDALERSEGCEAQVLELRSQAQVSTTPEGRLTVKPERRPADNILFHDGRNASLERLMTAVQQNALDYNLATSLLRKRFDGLLTAIRGRTT
jgi:flagellar basal-body rod protein FlgB